MALAETLYIPVANDVQLAVTSFGKIGKPVLILLHGAGQTRHSWRHAGQQLAAAGWHAVAVDTRGHGNSSWSGDGDYSVDTLIADLLSLVKAVETLRCKSADAKIDVRPVLVGASLGGICGMLAEGEALTKVFRSMVLVDITPSIENSGVARIIEFMSRYQGGFSSVEEAAIAVAAYQSHDSAAASVQRGVTAKRSAGLKKNLRLADDGRYYWHWDPRLMQHIGSLDESLYHRLRNAAKRLRLPVLLIRGQQSDIVSPESVQEFLELVPHAQFQDIADAAHMVAGDNNDVFTRAVLDFIGSAH